MCVIDFSFRFYKPVNSDVYILFSSVNLFGCQLPLMVGLATYFELLYSGCMRLKIGCRAHNVMMCALGLGGTLTL